jgi:hypothetical protein
MLGAKNCVKVGVTVESEMDADAQRSEVVFRVFVTVTAILLVFFAGGRTRWDALSETAGDVGITEVSAAALPDTGKLLTEAVSNGEIDEETALVYSVYALYGDKRLPAVFRAEVTEELDPGVLCVAAERWTELSPEAQAKLAPFLALPANSGEPSFSCAR